MAAPPAFPAIRPAALLLTGGASQRMGRHKATLVVDGATLAERTAALLLATADPVIEVGPGWSALPTVREDPPGTGPLAALAAGAAALRDRHHTGAALVVATDLPNLTAEFLRRLADHPAPTEEHCVVPRDRAGRPQPVCARYSQRALARAEELAAAGERSLMALLGAAPVTWIDADAHTDEVLFDVDTPEDLSSVKAHRPATPRPPPPPAAPRLAPDARSPATAVRVVAVHADHHLLRPDQVATEEPMEIRVAGPGQEPRPVAVTMRTPGHDFELAAGFLYTEGLVDGRKDVAAIRYCGLPEGDEQRLNIVTVELTRHVPEQRLTRTFSVNASCGVCGKASLEEVAVACAALPPPASPFPTPRSVVVELPERLRAHQQLFARTGGLHGAGLATAGGAMVAVREDVGRHNAVDKLVGQSLMAGRLPLHANLLVVSGRVSFEIVQKAARAGIPVLVAVSAPSSLAVAAAERLGLTLAAFVREDRFNLYSHPERIDLSR